MSRSRKKFECCKDYDSGKFGKKQANRKVRRCKGVFNGSDYKKIYDTWDIHDYVWVGFTTPKDQRNYKYMMK